MISETRKLYLQQQEEIKRMERVLADFAMKEFPIGSKVKWIRSYMRKQIYVQGTVANHGSMDGLYSWDIVSHTGTRHGKYPYELEHDSEPTREGNRE